MYIYITKLELDSKEINAVEGGGFWTNTTKAPPAAPTGDSRRWGPDLRAQAEAVAGELWPRITNTHYKARYALSR